MLGIYSLIWTICHKLMWFYRNAVLFHIIFRRDAWQNLVIWVIRVPWQSTKWRCRRCISEDGIIFMLLLEEIRLHLGYKAGFAAGACIGDLGQTDGRRKFELGIPQSCGEPYIRGVPYIRDKTVTRYWWPVDCHHRGSLMWKTFP